MVLILRNKRFYVNIFMITNWGGGGACMPQNKFGWRWLLIEDFCTHPPGILNMEPTFAWNWSGRATDKQTNKDYYFYIFRYLLNSVCLQYKMSQ